MQWKKI